MCRYHFNQGGFSCCAVALKNRYIPIERKFILYAPILYNNLVAANHNASPPLRKLPAQSTSSLILCTMV